MKTINGKTAYPVIISAIFFLSFIFVGCGSTEFQRIASQQVLKINNNLTGVEREIAKIRAVLLDEHLLEKVSKDKRKEINNQMEMISAVLRNFEKVRVGMKEEELRNLGFDIAAPNVDLKSGYKAITSWFGENFPIKPPFYIMGNEIPAKEADFLKSPSFRWAYSISPKNGPWDSFWSNRERKNVIGFDYIFEFMMLKTDKAPISPVPEQCTAENWSYTEGCYRKIDKKEEVAVGFRRNGGVVLTTKEEYESKKSKIGNAFKNPFDWIPRP